MGTWDEGLLDNDTAGDFEVFWDDYVTAGRARDAEFWTAKRIEELVRFAHFRERALIRPDLPEQAELLLAVGALFTRDKIALSKELKALIVEAANWELRKSRLDEWPEPAKRKKVLIAFLDAIGGERQTPTARKRPPSADVADIEAFMKRADHWADVVTFAVKYDDELDEAHPEFMDELKRFCFAGCKRNDEKEQRRAIIARLKALGFVTGWMLNLPRAKMLELVSAADVVRHPSGPQYAWVSEMYVS